MGFFDDLDKNIKMQAIIQATKKPDGKPDPYAALGAAMGTIKNFSASDQIRLGAMLGAQGAFDSDK
jgi:hypothetical protein